MLRPIEHEVGVGTPGRKQAVLEPRTGDTLEVLGGDDLVGVDVATPQRQRRPGVDRERVHYRPSSSRSGRSAGAVR